MADHPEGRPEGPRPHDLMTIPDAATTTGAAPRTIRSWIAKGRLEALPSRQGQMVSAAAVAVVLASSKRAVASAARTPATAGATTTDPALPPEVIQTIAQRLDALETLMAHYADPDTLIRAIAVATATELEERRQKALPAPRRRWWRPFGRRRSGRPAS